MLDSSAIHLPDCVLDFTEGKRALICGGQISREDLRQQIQCCFGFIKCDWLIGEIGTKRYITQAENKIYAGEYDLFFPIVKFSSHNLTEMARKVKKRIHVVYLTQFALQSISIAIDEQICRDILRKSGAHA